MAATGAGSGAPAGSPSTERASRQADIENARSTALSALHNDRFRSMLAQQNSWNMLKDKPKC